ncbi:MAG: TolC family protein [Ignavibacteria bacterium]|nr:TolC family protein [Ignavibacteria bacterium]
MKNRKISLLLLALIFKIFVSDYLISEVKQFNLQQIIEISISNNKELIYKKLEIEKAEATVWEARGNALPSLNISSSFNHYIQKPVFFFPDFRAMLNNSTYSILFKEQIIPEDRTKFVDMGLIKQSFLLANQFETKIQLNQIIFNSAVFRGIGASKIYLEISKNDYLATKLNLISNVKKAFFACLLMKNLYEIYLESLNNALANFNNIKSLLNQGIVSEFDYLQAEVHIENLKPIVENFRNLYKSSISNLKVLANIPLEQEIELVGTLEYKDFTLPDINQLKKIAFEKNANLITLEYKKKVDKEMIELYRSENYPTIVAFGNYSFAGQSDKLNFSTYHQSLVGIQFSINIFNGFQTKSRIEQATIASKQTEEQINLYKLFIEKTLEEKLLAFEKAKKQVLAQKKNIELAEKSYAIAKTKYNEGTAIQLEVKNAELELRQAKLNLQQAIFEYITAKIDIDNILGSVDYD